MPAALVSSDQIPALAAKVSLEMLEVLRRIQREGFILNGSELDRRTTTAIRALADLDLVDRGYEGSPSGEPYIWVSNGNGSRVLNYKTGLRSVPHYEIPSTELAGWLEQQGIERWWNVDGDPLLTGRMTFPCPADELAAELRKIDRPLLVQAKADDVGAAGQPINAAKLNEVVGNMAETILGFGDDNIPHWARDRLLCLCWKSSFDEWLLTEDSETAEQMRGLEKGKGAETARIQKE